MASTKTYPDISTSFHRYRNNNNSIHGVRKFDWQLLLATLVTIAFYTVTFVEIARDMQYEEAIGWQLKTELPSAIA